MSSYVTDHFGWMAPVGMVTHQHVHHAHYTHTHHIYMHTHVVMMLTECVCVSVYVCEFMCVLCVEDVR